jgi:hypothetical protein
MIAVYIFFGKIPTREKRYPSPDGSPLKSRRGWRRCETKAITWENYGFG